MNTDDEQRCAILRASEFAPFDYIHSYYGLDSPSAPEAMKAFEQYRQTKRKQVKCPWQEDRLMYASVPALVTECDLDTFYCDGDPHAVYLRLDLDYETLGTPFSHPLPHMELWGTDHLRLALEGGTNGNVVLDYLEFIYRNRVPDKWLAWARRQWLARTNGPANDDDPFERIIQAFEDNEFDVLKAHAHHVSQIKKSLREAKDSVFRAHMTGTDREILEYPSAR